MILMACFSFALDCLFVRKYSGRLGVVNKGFTLKTLNYTINSALFTSIACHFTKIDEMGEYYLGILWHLVFWRKINLKILEKNICLV